MPEPDSNPQASATSPRLIVVKVGSAVLTEGGGANASTFDRLAREIRSLRDSGDRVALVSSGAIACGLSVMGLGSMPTSIVQKQAAAAAGQPELVRLWADAFAKVQMRIGQVLLTGDDLQARKRFLNARRTIESLLDAGLVPIINENDSVSYDEIKLGDNDRLSALVAGAIGADLLVMLSVAPGVLDAQGNVVPSFEKAKDARPLVHDGSSATGVGGMSTKLDAVELAAEAGASAIILPGRVEGALLDAVRAHGQHAPSPGTRFESGDARSRSRKRWIARAAKVAGTVLVDAGAVRALQERGASLLPSGVVDVDSDFEAGSVVDICAHDRKGRSFARGLCSYSSRDVLAIRGKPSDEIESVLGYRYADAVIHRDDMVLLDDEGDPA